MPWIAPAPPASTGRGPGVRRARVPLLQAAGAAAWLGLVVQTAAAQTAGGDLAGGSDAGSGGSTGLSGLSGFAPPAPPLSGASPSGRDFGFAPPRPSGSPAGGLGAFGVEGGPAGEPGPPTGPARDYTITPRIDVSEGYETNVGVYNGAGVARGGHKDDFVTFLSPSVSLTADTPRLQGSLFYAPTVQLYAYNSSENSIGNNLSANGTLTVLGNALYVNASGNASIVPRFGGVSSGTFGGFGGGAANLPSSQQQQFYTVSVEPYAVHRFGDVGTAKVGYTYSESLSNANGTYVGNPEFVSNPGFGGGPFQPFAQQSVLSNLNNSNVTTSREAGEFISGDILGRVRSITLLSASQYGGGGVESGAYENFFTEQLGYALTHTLTVFAEGGYEDILYNTFPATRINDEIWSFGVQAAPNPDSSVILGYGHKYGFNSLFANGSYAVTSRTQITGVYTTGLGSALQGLQSTIGNSALDAFGNPVDFSTAAPTYIASGQLGTTNNNSLYRITQFTLTAATTLPRDTYSLQIGATNDNLIGTAAGVNAINGGPIASSQSSYSGIVTWRHELREDLSAAASLTYARSRQSGFNGSSDSYGADLVFNQSFSNTLSGYARYSYFENGGAAPGLNYSDNTFRIGLSKTF